MGSLRRSEGNEPIATDVQPAGYRNASEVVENVGAQLWDGTGWVDMAGDTQPTGAHNAKARVLNAGQMLWESVKKEWIPASSGATKDAEPDNEIQPIQNMLLNEVTGEMDRQRNNSATVEAFKSEARSKLVAQLITNYNARGVQIDLEITSAGSSGSLAVYLRDFLDHGTGIRISPIASTVSHVYTVYPGITNYPKPTEGSSYLEYSGEAQVFVNSVIAREFYIVVAPSVEVDWTYSLSYQLIV